MLPLHKVYVPESHGLSRLHVSDFPGLEFGDKWFFSLENACYYVLLVQLERQDVANELMNRLSLRHRPAQVYSWVTDTKGITLPVDFIYNSLEVYAALIAHQLSFPSGNFRDGFDMLLADVGQARVDNVRFYYVSPNDTVYGTGQRLEEVLRFSATNFPGSNMYGRMLEQLFRDYARGQLAPKWQIDELFTPSGIFGRSHFKKMVLIIGDSQLKYISGVSSGDVVSISGGRYHHIVNALDAYQLRLSDYRMIIVSAGVNVSNLSKDNQLANFAELRYRLVCEARRREDYSVLISPGFYHPDAPYAPENGWYVKNNVASEKIKVLDWSVVGNPFVIRNEVQFEFFDHTDPRHFHLGIRGLKQLWAIWQDLLPDLAFVRVNYSPNARSLPKFQFEEPPSTTRRLVTDIQEAVVSTKARSRKRRHQD